MKNKLFARLTAALTAVLMALSFAGCDSGEPSETAPGAAQTTVAAAPAAEKKTPEPIAEKPAPKTEPKADTTKAPAQMTSGKSTGTQKAATQKKAAATTKKATTKKATASAPQRSLIARTIDTSVQAEMNLINSAVSFGRDTIKFLTGRDPLIDVQIRSQTNSNGGIQLFLYVRNRTGRPIRLNGYSKFTIRDLLNEEVLSTSISLNEPIVLDDQEDTWLSVSLPKNWLSTDELRQITLEAGLFNSAIALDYDLL